MKFLSYIVGGENSFLGVNTAGLDKRFLIFDIVENQKKIEKLVPAIDADVWDFSEKLQLVACLSWENGKVSIFNAKNGNAIHHFFVEKATCLRFVDDRIRLIGEDISEFDLTGGNIFKQALLGSPIKDTKNYIITKKGKQFWILRSNGVPLFNFNSSGHGVTSFVQTHEGIAVAESGGPVTVWSEKGKMIWRTFSAEGYHPIRLGCNSSGDIFTIHAYFATMNSSLITVHDKIGKLRYQYFVEKCPAVTAFFPNLEGWICGDFEILIAGPTGLRRENLRWIE